MQVHVSETSLRWYLLGGLSQRDARKVGSHLETCPRCCGRLRETISAADDLATLQPIRNGRGEPASLLQLHPLITERWPVEILGLSRSGLTVSTQKPLDVGALVQIRTQATFIVGEVRYCLRSNGRFHAGIHMQRSAHEF